MAAIAIAFFHFPLPVFHDGTRFFVCKVAGHCLHHVLVHPLAMYSCYVLYLPHCVIVPSVEKETLILYCVFWLHDIGYYVFLGAYVFVDSIWPC